MKETEIESVVITGYGLVVRDHFSAKDLFSSLKNHISLITEDNRLKSLGVNNVPSAALTEHDIICLKEKTKKYSNDSQSLPLVFSMAYSAIIDALQESNLGLDLTKFNSEIFFANNKLFSSKESFIQLLTKFKNYPESSNENIDIEEFCQISQATNIFDKITQCLNLSTIPRIFGDACIAGKSALYSAYLNVKYKNRNVAIVCASEEATHPILQLTFRKIGALYDKKQDIPVSTASRAFDKKRSGCVLADAAACIVVESLSSAKARGAKIIAEIKGMSRKCEAYKITSSDESGKYYIESMKEAIFDAGLKPENIDFINAHGTSTQSNDRIESRAIEQLFPHRPPVVSTKSAIGHSLSVSGLIETILSCESINNKTILPSLNYSNPDDKDGHININTHTTSAQLNHVLSNSFGFGGENSCIVLSNAGGL